jgi:sugar phosphate isomerase/epimerase
MSTPKVSRRPFLAAAASAVVAPAFSWAAPPPRGRSGGLKLGLASYTMRKHSLERTLELCKELQIGYINLKDVHMPMTDSKEAMAAARQKIEAAGVQLVGGGTITLKNDAAQVRKAFEYARDAGFPLIVVAPQAETPDMVGKTLDITEKMIQEFGIKVAIHNHGPEDKYFPAPQDALARLKGRDKRFGLCVDIGHTARAGKDIVKTVAECGDRVLDLHVKDLKDATARDSQVEVGKGVLDIPGLFRALRKVGFQGNANLEYEINVDNPVVGVKECFSYMRGVLDAVEA